MPETLRQAARQTAHRVSRVTRRLLTPISTTRFRSALATVMGGRQEILFVHSSLSSCGHFIGGPDRVIGVLREFADTLCMPTHSYACYPAEQGHAGAVFDRAATPSEMGLLAEAFRRQPAVVRSIHSTHSLAAVGPRAEELCAGHYLSDTPCGAGTPYERLVRHRASVLMLGVSFAAYTLFHTAEWLSGSPAAFEPDEVNRLRVIDEQGEIVERLSKRQGRSVPRFHEAGELIAQAGFVRSADLGRSRLLHVSDCSAVHAFLVERLVAVPALLRKHCVAPLR